ncbi:methionine ABC transporter ATP-binding protein [Enterococcus casseliflavus]|uniref:methionine ABC transporter ATP-binding protein n=1 Tax=Enterococcus casseliflavus TaxID=37734 RepID=UPI0001B6D5F7|nr:ATP-binding cassette domain-containing protein [Enterococcus casseliflavus]EEV28842.1 methionine import ATP-binding protein metN [Enterococcus casseliflavus EC30]EEV35176.1 methionine import ATP-binding protein metN [Enterococcus casseliflavus EC10]OJG29719.1 metal ABC transporter ATP-binding protein [Enterococcus casseliflavus]QQU22495.1 ATP-binding cassette domain-containing protein [Enterococcus casseliflavus]STQ30719.1 ABC-type metal ion transport system, ATPase component [Enterococcus 
MLEAINITKRYDRNVLDGLSFAVQPGEIVGVVGKSGSGKSTLLRLLNLIETPDSGELLFDGKRIDPLNKKQLLHAQQEIGMIFQNYNLLHNRTVFENVYLPLKLMGKSSKKVLEMLSFVGMEDKADSYPAKLSGGEKQRVAIARALIREPKILLCDEPTSALDEDTKADVLALLQKVQQTFQPAVIFVSHELTAVRQICQRVFVLEDAVFAAEFVNQPQPIVRKESSYVDKVERSLLHDDQ